jgi:hypothetical protein
MFHDAFGILSKLSFIARPGCPPCADMFVTDMITVGNKKAAVRQRP